MSQLTEIQWSNPMANSAMSCEYEWLPSGIMIFL